MRRSMSKIFPVVLFIILMLTLVADPAPPALEITDLLLIILSLVTGLLAFLMMRSYRLDKNETDLLLSLIFYFSSFIVSAWIASLKAVPVATILRSVGPYINFFPLIALGLLRRQTISAAQIVTLLTV